jgi:hypothetical protein
MLSANEMGVLDTISTADLTSLLGIGSVLLAASLVDIDWTEGRTRGIFFTIL